MELEEFKNYLFAYKVKKDDKEYCNFVLVWRYNNSTYDIVIRPVFYDKNDIAFLLAKSKMFSSVEELRKFVKDNETKL